MHPAADRPGVHGHFRLVQARRLLRQDVRHLVPLDATVGGYPLQQNGASVAAKATQEFPQTSAEKLV